MPQRGYLGVESRYEHTLCLWVFGVVENLVYLKPGVRVLLELCEEKG